MDGDGILRAERRVVPDLAVYLLRGEYAVQILKEEFEQLHLGRRQADGLAVNGDGF